MQPLQFFDRSFLEKLPLEERREYQALVARLAIPDGFPFRQDSRGMPDQITFKFSSYLCGEGRDSPRTWKTYSEQVSLFVRYMDAQGIPWYKACYEDLTNYRKVRLSGRYQDGPALSPRSWNLAAAAIRCFFEFGVEQGLVDTTPIRYRQAKGMFNQNLMTHTLAAKFTPDSVNFISIDNYRRIWRPHVARQLVNGQRDLALDDFLIVTGLRISEATGLTMDQLPNPDDSAFLGKNSVPLTIIGKGNKKRRIPLLKKYLVAIKRYIAEDRQNLVDRLCARYGAAWKAPDAVFLSRTGSKLSSRSVEKRYKTLSRSLGVDVTPHGFRHTFAIFQLEAMIKQMAVNLKQLREKGADAYRQIMLDPLRQLQMLLGHSHVSTTFIYLDFLEEAEQLVTDSLEDLANWTTEN
jgi:integrase/recombinase XerC